MAGDPFENLLLSAYPNPERRGCPGTEKLRAMAQHPYPIEDSTAVHVRECSPCFAEFQAFRDASRAAVRRSIKVKAALTAVMVCAALALLLYWPNPKPASRTVEVAQLNFADDSAERGADEAFSAPRKIPTAARVLKMSLPAGSDPGNYEIEIRSAADLATAIRPRQTIALEGATPFPSLTYQLASRRLSAGSYAVAWRAKNTAVWHYGPFVVY